MLYKAIQKSTSASAGVLSFAAQGASSYYAYHFILPYAQDAAKALAEKFVLSEESLSIITMVGAALAVMCAWTLSGTALNMASSAILKSNDNYITKFKAASEKFMPTQEVGFFTRQFSYLAAPSVSMASAVSSRF